MCQPARTAKDLSGITDIRITACPEDNCSIPGFRKVPQDLNKYSRGSFVHLHFAQVDHGQDIVAPAMSSVSSGCHGVTTQTAHDIHKRLPITQISVLQGKDAEMGPGWERVEGNLNDGNHGPVLTLFVKRDADGAPIDSIVVKYGFDSHAAIGYDRLPMDLNVGTGGQWVYLYFKRAGPREPITHIATKACALPPCTMDDSWTRINRPIMTGTFKRYLYLFYKSIPGERPITSINLSLKEQEDNDDSDQEGTDRGSIDTGVRHKNSNVYVTYQRGSIDEQSQAVDNIAVQLGSNPVPHSWNAASFEHDAEQDVPDWKAQLIYRRSDKVMPKKPILRFKQDGSFKIVQFADIHMATGPHSCHNVPTSMSCIGDINTMEMMERMLDSEKPDLVVYTGDNVDGLTSNDAFSTIIKYSRPVIERGIPWTIVFGNHDEEGDLSREEMMSSAQDLPYSLSQRGPLEISGTGNYVLSIFDHKHKHGGQVGLDLQSESEAAENEDGNESDLRSEKGRFHLYFLDSGAYSFNLEHPGWDWIKDDQVEWFRQTSRLITSQYRPENVPNALAFFHIPIPEYAMVEDSDEDDDQDRDDDGDEDLDLDRKKKKRPHMVGDKNEGVSTPSYNSGMFEAFYESKDVRATTVGHDHINDYCLDHRGINLCYGGGLGYGTYGNPTVPRRSRVFEILHFGDRVDTWKRLDNEDMTLVGQQTLFVGQKSSSSSRGSPTKDAKNKNKSTRPSRLTDDLLERLRQGSQYVMDGLGGF
ncbi:purple acid phosphatase [Mortierella claussenii]|nr:purple acid phosphatase [Mortierella claussenii]